MSVTIKTRPQGAVFSTTGVNATIGALSTDLTLTKATHGLTTDDLIYVSYTSGQTIYPESYLGYFYAYVVDGNTIKLKKPNGTYVQVAGPTGGTVTYYKHILKHYYNALHLPIQYVLYSDTFPNTLDTARTVSSFANDNGYTQVTISGDIKASGSAKKLDWVKLSGGDYDGLYQIVSWSSDVKFTINLPYSSTSTLGGDTIQYYYNNYFLSVRIYGGLDSTHYVNTLTNQLKPYTLITTVKVVPDSSGYVYLNVANYLKNQFDIMKNNSLSDVWPLDLDSFSQFYISIAEYWDVSDGTSVTSTAYQYTYGSTYQPDTVYPYAVNASRSFGSRHSGYMSEYICGDSNNLAKFLTPMQNPKIFPSQYWDISFLNQFGSSVNIKKEYYRNSVLQSTSYDVVPDYGIGVYRNQLTIGAQEDRIDLTEVFYSSITSLASWTNLLVGSLSSGTSWTTGASPSVTTGSSSKALVAPITIIPGHTYSFTITITKGGGLGVPSFEFDTFNSSGTGVEVITGGFATITNSVVSFTATLPASYIGVWIQADAGSTTWTLSMFSYASEYITLSETKTVNVDTCAINADKYIDLAWKNHLGGFDYWRFKAFADRGLDILETRETQKNIFQDWPASYNEFQDRITYETLRVSKQTIVVRAENITQDEANDLFRIKASPVVQMMSSRYGKKTVIVDKDSFVYNNEKEGLQSLSFKLTLTDEMPVQSL